ncbi:hypothetical protein KIPB_011275 [Kipferlia bialata]|uniref:Uncharacterized protein n=1 Tax=Kipferlia bialata TaxID=797122 RepID=A0A9K3D4W9_9EUKA|nr:hypothetical protein KIPB_011275 [Kipferlia bialata]|eukprot:g11275.t1
MGVRQKGHKPGKSVHVPGFSKLWNDFLRAPDSASGSAALKRPDKAAAAHTFYPLFDQWLRAEPYHTLAGIGIYITIHALTGV